MNFVEEERKFEGHACWLLPRSQAEAWFGEAAHDTSLTCWALAQAPPGGRGAYLKPREDLETLLLLLLRATKDVNEIRHLKLRTDDAERATDVLCDWIVSMLPKRCRLYDDAQRLGLDTERLRKVLLL